MYLNDAYSSISRPAKQLRGFTKVSLEPGQEKRVDFSLTIEDLKFINAKGQRIYEAGEFNVYVADLPPATFILRTDGGETTTTQTTARPTTTTTSAASSLFASGFLVSFFALFVQKYF